MDNEVKELNLEETTTPEAENPPKRKKKNKTKMTIWYKIAFVLFCIALCLLIAAMVDSVVKTANDENSIFAIWASCLSCGFAFIGIVFACVSKEKKSRKRKRKKHKLKNGDDNSEEEILPEVN